MLEPEDAMKWETVHPSPEKFDFSQGDRLVEFATSHQMKVRGHTLVWHQQNPAWLSQGHYTPERLAQILEQHIKAVVGHYRGKVFAWDVVNEGFDERVVGKMRNTIWYDQPGIGRAGKGISYIQDCFRWAHAADPDALLFYNDAEAEAMNPKSDEIYAMVRDFRRLGVPIDGVGFQLHLANLKTSNASPHWECRCKLPSWTFHSRWMQTAMPCPPTSNCKPTFIAKSPLLAWRMRVVPQSRPGDSPISIPGSAPIPNTREVRRCSSIASIGQSPPMMRCEVCWKQIAVSRWSSVVRCSLFSIREPKATNDERPTTAL
jgi:hypothetical protein